ncbi:hypothetical protein BASA81_005557 [Batrachochytrium salamandrivorans]|nr:hypothetical protein BASA81_005557 [Batrachochytrium salamandrivorans]
MARNTNDGDEEEEDSMWNSTSTSSTKPLASALEGFREEAKQHDEELLRLAHQLKAKAVKPMAVKPMAQYKFDENLAKQLQREEDSRLYSDNDDQEEEYDFNASPQRKMVVASSSSEEEEVKPVPKRTFLVNPVNPIKKKKRVFIVPSSSEDEEEEKKPMVVPQKKKQLMVEISSDSASADSGESDGDEEGESDEGRKNKRKADDTREQQVQEFMNKCEDISHSLLAKLGSNGQNKDTLNESTAQELVGNVALKLNPYQIAGVNWISLMDRENINPVLADEMGLGKTITSIAFLRLLMRRDGNSGPHLIIAPASTLDNWQRELALWLPELGAFAYQGTQEERRDMRRNLLRTPQAKRPKIWLCTYTYFERESCVDDRRFLAKQEFEVMILDEAHAIKNTESARYQSLLQLQSKRKLLLTGTPCQNKLDELFALLSFCLPKSLLDCRKLHVREAIFGQGSDPARVKRILQPFILRRLKSQVLRQLAPKTETTVLLDMSPAQKRIYQSVVLDFKNKVKSKSATSESVFTELRKSANHPLMIKQLFGGKGRDLEVIGDELFRVGFFGRQATRKMVMQELTQKLSDWDLNAICQSTSSQVLRDMVLPSESMFDTSCKMQYLRKFLPEQIQNGHRILLFSQWTKLLDLFEELLAQLEISFMRLDGSTAVDTRQELMDQFNGGLAPVFLLSTRAGGLGINLSSADVVVLHDLDFNPAIDNQAMDRCHRFGQTKPVTVYKLVTRDTVDENISEMQVRKTGMNRVLLGEEDGDDENEDVVLLPKIRDFEANFEDMDDKERELINKQMMQQAVKDAVANV